MGWSLPINHYFSTFFSVFIVFNRGLSVGRGWKSGPIRFIQSLRQHQKRCTCLTWTAFCRTSQTHCSLWPRSPPHGVETAKTVSTAQKYFILKRKLLLRVPLQLCGRFEWIRDFRIENILVMWYFKMCAGSTPHPKTRNLKWINHI